ncbi:MAG: glycosyltransferase family 39 protein [bacterium]|nr:glycosyltransferase family 39 protein [bacterium]
MKGIIIQTKDMMVIRKNRYFALCGWVGVLVIFFCLYSYIPFQTLSGPLIRLSSPDETANYYFSKMVGEKMSLGFDEPALAVSKNFIHPRSMTAVVDKVRPVSFLGLTIFYGVAVKAFGEKALLFFTPLLAVLAIPFFYLLIRRIFKERVALVASLLLLIHPAYWYYTSRSMMHNVLFVDLCIIGFSLLLTQRHFALKFLGGLFIGASLMVRFSEVIWVFAVLAVLLCFCFRRVKPLGVVAAALGVLIPIGALLAMNNQVYGNPISFGYQTVDTSTAIVSLQHSSNLIRSFDFSRIGEIFGGVIGAAQSLRQYILPFGFAPHIFLQHFMDYAVTMFWWFAPLIVFGVAWSAREGLIETIRNRRLDDRLILIVILGVIAVWLVIFYGSWLFNDNITKNVTIGNSYVRYWLPITVLALPFAAQCLVYIGERARGIVRVALISCICALIVFYSFRTTLWDGPESLFAVAGHLSLYREKALMMNSLTPPNAIIFSQRSDKIFFPDRKVAQIFDSYAELPLVPQILAAYPIYYYGFWTEKDADYVSHRYFEPLHLKLVYIATFDENERLFQVIPLK